MRRIVSTNLDLSRLPPPLVVRPVNYELIRRDRLSSLTRRFAAAGIPWDVDGLETDPAVILQEEDGFRELLDLQAINDAARARMLAFARGADLDHLAAFYGVQRMVLQAADPATGRAAVMESDRSFRERVQLAPEALTTTGTAPAYVFHARDAHPEIQDAAVLVPGPGRVIVVALSRAGHGVPSAAALEAVRRRVTREDVKPLTVDVTVSPVLPVPFTLDATLVLPPGPDPAPILAEAQERWRATVAERRTIGTSMPVSAVHAALHVSGVRELRVRSPLADVPVGAAEVAFCAAAAIDTFQGEPARPLSSRGAFDD